MKKLSKILLIIFLIIPILIYAEEVNTTYQGEYSLDYLLRNSNAVTFNKMDNPTYDFMEEYGFQKGNVNFNIEGPVLINGAYYNDTYSDEGLIYSIKNPKNVVSHINGTTKDYVQTNSKVSTNKNFIDYEKLYKQILSESQTLVEKTEYHINSKEIFINKPGIYQINSTRVPYEDSYSKHNTPLVVSWSNYGEALVKAIYIDNYDSNEYYIINNMKTYELDNYYVLIKKEEDETFKTIDEFIDTENYTGNIIFNYPNARMIYSMIQSGKIVAPNANVFLSNYSYFFISGTFDRYADDIKGYHDSIIANSIQSANYDGQTKILLSNVCFLPYDSNKKIEFESGELIEVKEIEDFEDDIYTGTYTINEMLGNYSVISLGQKAYEANTFYHQNSEEEQGNVTMFHIAGQLLINGNITSGRLDLESNRVNESFYKNNWVGKYYYYPGEENKTIYDLRYKSWGDGETLSGSNSVVFSNSESWDSWNTFYHEYSTTETYINFERLYNKIVEEQKEIKKGILVTPVDGIAHIEVGENYYIEDINQINEIVFDNFEANSEKMTVITVLNSDYINFPKISQTVSGNYVPTKDYFGKEEPMFEYEYYNFPDDIYAGNIIWNVPDSKYIKFETQTPIIGHLVAPNADVEMKETHFAGGFIVNSLYAEGNSEAHFYPLQPIDVPENYDCFVANTNYFNGKWYTDETVLVVNPTAKEVLGPPKEEITNPKTGDNYKIVIVLSLAVLLSIVTIIFIEKRKTII